MGAAASRYSLAVRSASLQRTGGRCIPKGNPCDQVVRRGGLVRYPALPGSFTTGGGQAEVKAVKQTLLFGAFLVCSASLMRAQSLTVPGTFELTVTKVERLATWQPAGSEPPVAATAGKEFIRLYVTARLLAGGGDNVCQMSAGEFELFDTRGRRVVGMTVGYVLAPDTEWKRRCSAFTVEFEESPLGVGVVRLGFRESQGDISMVPGARSPDGR